MTTAWGIAILLMFVGTYGRLSKLIKVLIDMTTQFANLQQAVDTLTATITAEDTVIDGAAALITSIPDLITAAVNDALQKGAPPSTLSAFSTLNDVIQQKSGALAAAVATSKTGAPTSNPPVDGSGSDTPPVDPTAGDTSTTDDATT